MSLNQEKLIDELLHNAKASGGRPLERRLADLTVWYYKNRETTDPLAIQRRMDLLDKAFWTLLEINALQTERIHELEAQKAGKMLWLPKGLAVDGGTRRYG